MKRFLREYFTFSRSEFRVVLALSCLICLSLAIREIGLKFHDDVPSLSSGSKQQAKDFIASIMTEEPGITEERDNKEVVKKPVIKPFEFDPNSISKEELVSMGLPGYTADNLVKYRKAGGRFAEPSDVAKIYGLNRDIYLVIEPFISIKRTDDVVEKPGNEKINRRVERDFLIEINTAAATEFEKINGIGEVLSERIIRYRELIGGFVDASQLSEVYGVSDSIVERNIGHFRVDTTGLRKISLNASGYSALIRHPYLGKQEVRAILKFREFSKEVISPSDLVEAGVIPDSIMQKISPYLQK